MVDPKTDIGAQACGEDQKLDNDVVLSLQSDMDSESSLDTSARETFEPTIQAIRSAWTTESIASSPRSNGWEPFRHYWYDIFTKIVSDVESNPNIPRYMTDPPCPKFNIKIFRTGDYNPGCCPCVFPDCEPNITLENPGGVTKGEVVKAVRDYLYGEQLKDDKPPKVWKAQKDPGEGRKVEGSDYEYLEVSEWTSEEEGMTRMKEPVVWKIDWATLGWIDREDLSKGRQCLYGNSYAEVFFYACEAGEHEDKAREKKRGEEKEEGEG